MKYFSGLLLIITSFVYLTPAVVKAASENVVIYQVQTGSPASASQELVLLLDSSADAVNVSDWCLFYSSASNTTERTLVCLDSPLQTEIWLEPSGIVSFASGEFVIANPGFVSDATFTSGIATTGGHVWIGDQNSIVKDRIGWGTASAPETSASTIHASGKVLSRNIAMLVDTDNNFNDFSSRSLHSPITSGLFEVQITIDLCLNIADFQAEIPVGYLQDDLGDCFEDMCSNLDELQKEIPIGYEKFFNECVLIPLENSVLLITELLPNAVSSDTGKEFIEIYNPNSYVVNLAGYRLEVGPSFAKQFVINDGQVGAGKYIMFSDFESGIVLPNTNGVQLRLTAPSGAIVSETPIYSNAPDNSTWALFDDQWIYTNQSTPADANQPYLVSAEDEEVNVTTVLAPCPTGKYRNPETNRCRSIETAVSSLAPCEEDEYRNPDTNRCRKVVSGTVLAACAVGQERNPETNRCRKIATLASNETSLSTVEDIEVANTPGKVNWFVILVALGGTFSYIIYEWRSEIRQRYISLRY